MYCSRRFFSLFRSSSVALPSRMDWYISDILSLTVCFAFKNSGECFRKAGKVRSSPPRFVTASLPAPPPHHKRVWWGVSYADPSTSVTPRNLLEIAASNSSWGHRGNGPVPHWRNSPPCATPACVPSLGILFLFRRDEGLPFPLAMAVAARAGRDACFGNPSGRRSLASPRD